MGVPRQGSGSKAKRSGSAAGAFGRLLLSLLFAAVVLSFAWWTWTGSLPYVERVVELVSDRYLDFDGDGVGGGRGMCQDVEYPDGTVARCAP